jgi:hypothetical protein
MSMNLANSKWLEGDESGLLGQFASNSGYSALIFAAEHGDYPELEQWFESGVTDRVAEVQKELEHLVASASSDVASTASALLELTKGQDLLIVTNGGC